METVLVTGSECTFRRLCEKILNDARIALPNTIELGTLEATKRCAISGMGLAVMPKMAIIQELDDDRLVPLAWPGLRIPISVRIIRHRNRWASPAVQELWHLAERCLTSEGHNSAAEPVFSGLPR
jgi:DNA-binding transcriptional LysR family regulator